MEHRDLKEGTNLPKAQRKWVTLSFYYVLHFENLYVCSNLILATLQSRHLIVKPGWLPVLPKMSVIPCSSGNLLQRSCPYFNVCNLFALSPDTWTNGCPNQEEPPQGKPKHADFLTCIWSSKQWDKKSPVRWETKEVPSMICYNLYRQVESGKYNNMSLELIALPVGKYVKWPSYSKASWPISFEWPLPFKF